jgi:signal transduction histidine kinase
MDRLGMTVERSRAVETSLDLQGLLHAILTCVTAGPGLGFNRAVLFLTDDAEERLVAAMAIGPGSPEEAHATWSRLANERTSLDELLHKPPSAGSKNAFEARVEGLSIPLAEASAQSGTHANPLLAAYRCRQVVRIADPKSLREIPADLRDVLDGTEVVCVPLIAKERSIGLIIADNAFSGERIDEQRVQLLQLLALLAGLALDNVRIYKQLERQARQLGRTLEELRATQEQLIHSERLATVGAVVARVSHEIRNPLTTIGGFARTLSAHPDEIERVARNANIIVDEVEKLEALLKEMLDFTSPKPPHFEPADLNRVITGLANVHRGELEEHKVTIEVDLAPDLPGVLVDRNQMQRVLLNLWQNAVQSMDEQPADRARLLTVRTWRDGNRVKVACSDTGRGIPRTVLTHIFTPFFTTKQRGTGLGLAVIKKIIDDHQGSIEVRDDEPPGASFIISLPIER